MPFRICALDDDEATLYTLGAMARTQGWGFKGSSSVAECLSWIRECSVDMLLLDYHMPQENGLDVLRRVKAISGELPVLILTVEQDPATAENLLLAGADDFINKPVRLADFLSRIRLHRRLIGHEQGRRVGTRKGIATNKLQLIVEFLKERNDGTEIEELAELCGLSYTTAHRYLNYLVKTGYVAAKEIQQYGKPGRPTHSYKFVGIQTKK